MRCLSLTYHALAGLLLLSIAARPAAAQSPSVELPRVLERVPAEYPADAAAHGVGGTVELRVTVGADGRVDQVTVERSATAELDDAAIAAVRRWRFTPATRDGRALASVIRVPIVFEPPKSDQLAPATAALTNEPPASPPPSPAGPATRPPAEPTGAPALPPPHEDELQVTVRSHSVPPNRGSSDFNVHVGELARVPRRTAAELLQLAPGFHLSNEGGDGHAQQIFLRGFDAREGQDLELSVDGVPINQVGNIHGNGYADLNFIIPETVESLRVLEGPFDPRQGNFAVAGSADYQLGLARRGVTTKYTRGSFQTERLLLLYGPGGESTHTFGAAELYRTNGFGQNRSSRRGSILGQYEGELGRNGSWRVLATGYTVDYASAGVLRDDLVRAGKVGFFDTLDDWQGGNAERWTLAGQIESHTTAAVFSQQLFVVRHAMELRENFTGQLLDPQEPFQLPHTQRGDRIEKRIAGTTIGARGFGRWHGIAHELKQEFEVGYLARGDLVDGTQDRLTSGAAVPYRRELDLTSRTANIGLYADVGLHPAKWLTLRGGLRGELFTYDVLDRCAAQSVRFAATAGFNGDSSCFSQTPDGDYRLPTASIQASGATILPRGTVILGPVRGFSFSASWGKGARSIDPQYVNPLSRTPLVELTAMEGGVLYARTLDKLQLTARSSFFRTHVDRDYVFSQTAGRNTLANGTTRVGWLGAVRAGTRTVDVNTTLTLVRSTFDDTGLLVPYVPSLVSRTDLSWHRDLPWHPNHRLLQGSLAGGFTYVGPRELPYSQRSEALATVDATGTLELAPLELGLVVTNLLDRRYKQGEYFYPSDFGSQSAATLVPARHFTAGAPRTIFLTATLTLGGES